MKRRRRVRRGAAQHRHRRRDASKFARTPTYILAPMTDAASSAMPDDLSAALAAGDADAVRRLLSSTTTPASAAPPQNPLVTKAARMADELLARGVATLEREASRDEAAPAPSPSVGATTPPRRTRAGALRRAGDGAAGVARGAGAVAVAARAGARRALRRRARVRARRRLRRARPRGGAAIGGVARAHRRRRGAAAADGAEHRAQRARRLRRARGGSTGASRRRSTRCAPPRRRPTASICYSPPTYSSRWATSRRSSPRRPRC